MIEQDFRRSRSGDRHPFGYDNVAVRKGDNGIILEEDKGVILQGHFCKNIKWVIWQFQQKIVTTVRS
jgi:hypothetical protein